MNKTDEEILGIDTSNYPARGRRGENLGKLHSLLQKGFPDHRNADGTFAAKRLAKDLGVSYQAVYKWFERERIAPKRIVKIVELSKKQVKANPASDALVFDDF